MPPDRLQSASGFPTFIVLAGVLGICSFAAVGQAATADPNQLVQQTCIACHNQFTLQAVRFLVEECGADINLRDANGYTPLHHAASRGDQELIHYLLDKGADVKVLSRSGQTTADMANGPTQRVAPFPDTIALLVGLGAVNNNNCVSC